MGPRFETLAIHAGQEFTRPPRMLKREWDSIKGTSIPGLGILPGRLWNPAWLHWKERIMDWHLPRGWQPRMRSCVCSPLGIMY
jgi:hypothetical protein